MKTDTIKQSTIRQIKEVLHQNKKYYISSDFPFVQIIGLYLTYQAKVMNKFLHERGFMRVKAKEIDFNMINSNVKVRGNRNVYITMNNYLRYKKEKV
jgi:hypothetical protein